MEYFESEREAFSLTGADWRAPQLGALGSLLAHWTLAPEEPALVSLPTGTGKTGVALAAPFITPKPPRRVLVLVPSSALRDQTVEQFRTMRLLRDIRALTRWYDPPRIHVEPVRGTATDWSRLADVDVAVAIPQSISPASTAAVSVPPSDMFDLVIVDEAHHLPAATWRSVLDHLDFANALFLTATPFRLDKKPVPGTRTYYFPLRQAIAEEFYKPIRPVVLERPEPYDLRVRDATIAREVVRLFMTDEHRTSALLVRAKNRQRAEQLADRYRRAGLEISVLTSQLSEQKQRAIVQQLNRGELRAVAVVGMLGEGFDLPRLRLVAYHDKHKSMPATVQLIGRLARVNRQFPQESVLVTVNDTDVHPELEGAVRELYREDADWAAILPGLADAEVAAQATNRAFVETLREREGEIDPSDLHPMPRPTIYEVDLPAWHPLGPNREIPEELHVGKTLTRALILMAIAAEDGSMLAFVTRRRGIPPWSTDLTLEAVEYGLNVVSFRATPRTDLPSLLFIDASDSRIHRALLDALALPNGWRPVATERLDGYLQSLPRISVSSIGMRNILAGTSGTSYKTRAGTSTDTDLLSTETTQTALGHVMMQVAAEGTSTTVGGAFEKGKIWQRRYKSPVDYSEWVTEAAELLWFPRTGSVSSLLPQISRGRVLEEWPNADPIAIEPNPAAAVGGYQLFSNNTFVGALEDFELYPGLDPTGSVDLPPRTTSSLPVVGIIHNRDRGETTNVWNAIFAPSGRIAVQGSDLEVRRGYHAVGRLSEFLEDYPPLIYFLNGQAVQGHEIFDVQGGSAPQYDPRNIITFDWKAEGVDLRAETRDNAKQRNEGISIHEGLERYLLAQPRTEQWRWLLCNDGSGEIADYIVLEWTRGRPIRLSLWHAKAAGGAPGLRVGDFQVVTAQALRSRSRFNDPSLWDELRDRIMGRSSPKADLVSGSDGKLRLLVLLGEGQRADRPRSRSWNFTRPLVHGEICVVQPGLSRADLVVAPSVGAGTTAGSLRQLFGVLADTIAVTGNRAIVLGSP